MIESVPERNPKKYNNLRLTIGISKGIATFILLLYFLLSGLSTLLERILELYISNGYLLFITYFAILGIITSAIFAPVNFYTDYILEHKFNLSNQTFSKWISEKIKSVLVSSVVGVPILLLFFWALNTFYEMWWLPFAIILFLFSVVLAKLVPIIILPIFYKVTPITNEELKERIYRLSKDAGLKVENVFQFDMSKNTKKANAAFTGLGKTKKIILGDTLLENFSEDEIETVIAHELGHYKKKHIVKNIFVSTVSSFLIFFLIAKLYSMSLDWFGFITITQISAMPLLSFWAMVIGLIQSPLSNMMSRKFEYEADEYAVKSTGKKEAFINTLKKLTEQNLGDKEPHPFVEWFYYSHPSIKNRINFINSINI